MHVGGGGGVYCRRAREMGRISMVLGAGYDKVVSFDIYSPVYCFLCCLGERRFSNYFLTAIVDEVCHHFRCVEFQVLFLLETAMQAEICEYPVRQG